MTALPAEVQRWLEASVGEFRVIRAVGGGCINPAIRIGYGDQQAFLKFNAEPPAGMFAVEAAGLRAMREAAPSLRVPQVLGVFDPDAAGGPGALLIEWLEPAPPDAGHAARLGRGLAEMHRTRGGVWGWEDSGFIGPIPVANDDPGGWPEFWWSRRIEPMLLRMHDRGFVVGSQAQWGAFRSALPDLLAPAEEDGPSLLHGDLWSGNVMATHAGERSMPALVDPAVYRGHREVDLAMAELFGGFADGFHDAYGDAWPLLPGWQRRRHAYQLFYLLVHVILFGAAYVGRSEQALRAAVT